MSNIVDSIKLENKNVLDIGCYDGAFLSLIKHRNNNFYGIEASDYGVKECIKKRINIKQIFFDDKTKIPFEDNFFDLIIAGEIIEHIYDTDFFLDEILRLLKPNAMLIISTPNIASLGRRLLLMLGISPIIELSLNKNTGSGHIRYFTFATLKDLLEKHFLKVLVKKSDVVNLSRDGKFKISFLAKIIPSFGQSIIYLCQKQEA
ncbi:MAG: class I SAM-dependent methyltransferase [bacterium]|nr:class I SAM-dependent methyltransferase [bacterium]